MLRSCAVADPDRLAAYARELRVAKDVLQRVIAACPHYHDYHPSQVLAHLQDVKRNLKLSLELTDEDFAGVLLLQPPHHSMQCLDQP